MEETIKCPRCGSKNTKRTSGSEWSEIVGGTVVGVPLAIVSAPLGKTASNIISNWGDEVGKRIGKTLHNKMKCKDCKHCWDI